SGGDLPTGLTLSPRGAFSGRPTVGGVFPITVRATDGGGAFGGRDFLLEIGAITINPDTLPAGQVGASYNRAITQTGGAAPVTFRLSKGKLPTGLTCSPRGRLSGMPTVGGVFPITVKATDVNGAFGERAYLLEITSGRTITINPGTLPAGQVGAPYNLTITQTGGVDPVTF